MASHQRVSNQRVTCLNFRKFTLVATWTVNWNSITMFKKTSWFSDLGKKSYTAENFFFMCQASRKAWRIQQWTKNLQFSGRMLYIYLIKYTISENESESHSVVADSLQPHRLYSPWNSPGKNTGVGTHSLLWGIFPTQGSNPGLPHCRWILYLLSYKGSPRILEWVAYPFPSGSSRPRNQTRVTCITGGFFTNWTMRKAKGVLIK